MISQSRINSVGLRKLPSKMSDSGFSNNLKYYRIQSKSMCLKPKAIEDKKALPDQEFNNMVSKVSLRVE